MTQRYRAAAAAGAVLVAAFSAAIRLFVTAHVIEGSVMLDMAFLAWLFVSKDVQLDSYPITDCETFLASGV